MGFLRRTFCISLAAWISLAAFDYDVRRAAGQRVRMARSAKLELDHHSDLSHEGESHSLDALYSHHQLLESRTGAVDRIALSSQFPVADLLPGDPPTFSPPPPALDPRIAIPPGVSPPLPEAVPFQGRAPPSSV